MFHYQRVLLPIGVLLLGFPSCWKTLADDCIDLRVHAPQVASCCKHEAFMDPDTFENCFQTVDTQNPEKNVQSVVCAFDCAYRGMGFLQGEDDIDVGNINKNQAAYDDAYQETIANAVNHCVAIKDDIRQEAERVQTTCSSFAVKFHACVIIQETLNCPTERWNDSPICEKLKSGTPVCKK